MAQMMRVSSARRSAAQAPLVPVVQARAQACKRHERLRARTSSQDQKKATVLEPTPDQPLEVLSNDTTGQTGGDFFRCCVQLVGLQVRALRLFGPLDAPKLQACSRHLAQPEAA